MEQQASFSLKTKILFSIIGLPSLLLITLFFWSIASFQKDKMAYIFESVGSHSMSLSERLSSKLDEVQRVLSISFTKDTNHHVNFCDILRKEWLPLDGLDALIYQSRRASGSCVGKDFDSINVVKKDRKKWQAILGKITPQSKYLQYNEDKREFVFGTQIDSTKLLMIFKKSQFIQKLLLPGTFHIALLDSSGATVFQTESSLIKKELEIPYSLQKNSIVLTAKNKFGNEYMMGYAPLKGFDFVAVTSIPKNEALFIIRDIMKKSILGFCALLTLAMIVGLFLAEDIAGTLKDILTVTKDITGGQFDVKVKVKRIDELGLIGRSINLMAVEIRRLLRETANKVRMEHEIKLTRILQSTFFPQNDVSYGNCKISGYYKSASECSGDWWYHLESNGKIYFFIGDATGHGVSAAFLTGTVFTALSTIVPSSSSLTEIAHRLNETVFQIHQGQIMMTLFMGEYDQLNKSIKFVNASHEVPLVLRKKEGPFDKKDIEILLEGRGPRVGERPNCSYEASNISLNKGDRVVCYTDGLFGIKNRSGQVLAERFFYRLLAESHGQNETLSDFSRHFLARLNEFEAYASDDDVTFFTLEVG